MKTKIVITMIAKEKALNIRQLDHFKRKIPVYSLSIK